MADKIFFPQDFIWGTATSAYQIEGGAFEDGKGLSIWDEFCRQPGRIAGGQTGNVACDHYHRLDEDLDLIAGVAPHYRFSLSWSRILPDGTGRVNPKGVDFYNRLIDGLLARGVTPWVTLYHWDLPQALEDRGGWANRDVIEWFGEYSDVCLDSFGDRAKNWMTVNEPSVVAFYGNALGVFAPGIRDETSYWANTHHLNLTIGETYRRMKARAPDANVGATFTPVPCYVPEGTVEDEIFMECVWHWNNLDPIMTGQYPEAVREKLASFFRPGDELLMRVDLDFIGLQHYSPIYFTPDPDKILGFAFAKTPDDVLQNDLGWAIDPVAFTGILMQLHRKYGKRRWLVTENGIALNDRLEDGAIHDPRRVKYMKDYLTAIAAAHEQGMDVGGYFAWSLMDNFEWASGFGPRFGLIHIDYENGLKRTPKDSYRWFADLVKEGIASF